MRDLLLTSAAIIDLSANMPYIKDALKGKTKPNVASWSTWTLINLITIVAALKAGSAINTAVLGSSYFLATFVILMIALVKGTRKYTVFDGVCQGLAILGIILWQVSGNPSAALLFVIISGEVAAIPTFRHAYTYPNEETLSTFVLASIVAVAFVSLAPAINFASLAVPIDLVLGNGIIALIIYFRRRTSST